jgi:hypothetical protein
MGPKKKESILRHMLPIVVIILIIDQPPQKRSLSPLLKQAGARNTEQIITGGISHDTNI